MLFTLLRIGTLLVASLSPLCTFAALWQMKEWRIDRLMEHYRAEGFWRQTKGVIRPAILVIGGIATYLAPVTVVAADATLLTLAVLTVVQIILKKQRYPVWTSKAIILVCIATILSACTAFILTTMFAPTVGLVLSVVVLLQTDMLFLAWVLFKPIDTAAKKRAMSKATKLRGSYKDVTVIGITGSVGKTTTKELLAHILKSKTTLCTPAYVNSEMGVAKWLLQVLPKHKPSEKLTIIIEMGAYRIGEIQQLCNITKPTMGIITHIGTQHIGLFGSQEKLLNAKAELIASLPATGTALLNADNTYCEALVKKTQANVQTVGTGGHANVEAFDIEETGAGIRFRVADTVYSVPIQGTHNVTNILLAITAAKSLHISTKDIAAALQTFTPLSNTFAVRSQNDVTVLDDTHNASPESFQAAISWAEAQPANQKILITPGVIEQGENDHLIHKQLGIQANGIFDTVIFTNPKTANMFADGYQGNIEMYKTDAHILSQGDLLVCVGRVPQSAIQNLLP